MIVASLLLLGILILRYVITSRRRPGGVKLPYVLGWLCEDSIATGSMMFRGAIALCRLSDTSLRPQVGVWESLVPGCYHLSMKNVEYIKKYTLHFGSTKSSASGHTDIVLCYNFLWEA